MRETRIRHACLTQQEKSAAKMGCEVSSKACVNGVKWQSNGKQWTEIKKPAPAVVAGAGSITAGEMKGGKENLLT